VLLFVGLCLLLRNPRLAAWLIPAMPAPLACFGPARQQFREQNLQRTAAPRAC
jgi:putative membrane protein